REREDPYIHVASSWAHGALLEIDGLAEQRLHAGLVEEFQPLALDAPLRARSERLAEGLLERVERRRAGHARRCAGAEGDALARDREAPRQLVAARRGRPAVLAVGAAQDHVRFAPALGDGDRLAREREDAPVGVEERGVGLRRLGDAL